MIRQLSMEMPSKERREDIKADDSIPKTSMLEQLENSPFSPTEDDTEQTAIPLPPTTIDDDSPALPEMPLNEIASCASLPLTLEEEMQKTSLALPTIKNTPYIDIASTNDLIAYLSSPYFSEITKWHTMFPL